MISRMQFLTRISICLLLLASIWRSSNTFSSIPKCRVNDKKYDKKYRASGISSLPCFQLKMVRNIDFPEALIFYDSPSNSILFEKDGMNPRFGLVSLIDECRDVGTPALLITGDRKKQKLPKEVKGYMTIFEELEKPPNPRSLYEAIQSITIQPEGFGGSSGFGRKLADPERPPMPQYVVVFCENIDVTRAARFSGMRVLCFEDNDLADAIIDDYDLYLEDVATPGSFWLNPPYPRDDEGNKVDFFEMMERMEQKSGEDNFSGEINENARLQTILDDMDPL